MRGYTIIEEGCVDNPKNSRPQVSVIVPVYNAARYLDQALTSIETQTLPDIEIICINDGSTDDSLGILQAHAAQDERIRIVDRPNGGYGSACNQGLDEARGKWVAILEPDDYLLPNMYEAMTRFASGFKEPIDIIKAPYWRILNSDTPQEARLNCSYRRRVKPRKQPFRINEAPHLLRHHPSIWSALYRRTFLEENDIRFPEYPGAGWADNPFLVETLCQARAIAYLDEPFYCYREESPEEYDAFVRRSGTMPLERWQAMMDVLERINVDEPAVMGAMVRRGFTYLDGIVEVLGMTDEVQTAAQAMFARMNPDDVFADPELSPANKQLFAEFHGIEVPPSNKAAYAASLMREGLYTLSNNGVGYTLSMVAKQLKH